MKIPRYTTKSLLNSHGFSKPTEFRRQFRLALCPLFLALRLHPLLCGVTPTTELLFGAVWGLAIQG